MTIVLSFCIWAILVIRIACSSEGSQPSRSGYGGYDDSSARSGRWLGWGGGISNNRSASNSSVTSANIGSLQEVCSVRYDPGVSAPPLIKDGIAYFTTWSGLLVAQKYQTGETIWTRNVTEIIPPLTGLQNASGIDAVSRSTPVTDGEHIFLGTVAGALLLVVGKTDGALLDTMRLDEHPLAIITQPPTFYGGKVFIGVSSLEVAAAALPGYECCTHVGTINVVTFEDGTLRLAWSQSTITQPQNVTGPPFSGASVWGSQPAIDPTRKQVFIATGNTHSVPNEFEACQNATQSIEVIARGLVGDPCLPRDVYQESVLALDIETVESTGRLQLGRLDAWNVACVSNPSTNCPAFPGPDGDFGMAPSFVPGSTNTPHGLDIVVVGQKNGNLYALSAVTGFVLWATQVSPAGLEGGLSWGMAVDEKAAYYTAINTQGEEHILSNGSTVRNSAFGATSLVDGSVLWKVAAPARKFSQVPPSVVNDVVLVGTTGVPIAGESGWLQGPGSFLALSKEAGAILLERPLNDFFKGGIAVVDEYVVFGSGYKSGGTTGGLTVFKVRDLEHTHDAEFGPTQ